MQARRDEARLKAELATIQANGNGNHAAAPEELEDLRAANAKLQERVTELQQTNGKLQVEIGDVQRRFDQVQQDLADAAVRAQHACNCQCMGGVRPHVYHGTAQLPVACLRLYE